MKKNELMGGSIISMLLIYFGGASFFSPSNMDFLDSIIISFILSEAFSEFFSYYDALSILIVITILAFLSLVSDLNIRDARNTLKFLIFLCFINIASESFLVKMSFGNKAEFDWATLVMFLLGWLCAFGILDDYNSK